MKNNETITNDGVAVELEKPSFVENLKESASRAKEIALENLGDLKDSAGDFAKRNLKKFPGRHPSG